MCQEFLMWAEDKNVDVKAYMTFLIVYVISRDFFLWRALAPQP